MTENVTLRRVQQIWILSEFGKPIFSSSGREEDFCDTFALVQTLIKRYEAWEDNLLTLQTSNVYVHFSYKRPLIMCIVSRSPSNLSIELDLIHNQVLALLTKSILKGIYAKMGDNFDLRRWLDGIHKRVHACVKVFNEDPVVFLSGFRILPLNPLDRDFVISTMASAINEISPKIVPFGMLIVHRQLVALVRMKHLDLSSSDFNIVVNMIECHDSLRTGETWVPICLPHFDSKHFLYAYIYYLWEGSGPCLILLSIDKESFPKLSEVRVRIEENLSAYKRYPQLKTSISCPDAFTLQEVNCAELYHFMHKNVLSSQVCCASPKKPYITHDELRTLYEGYFKLSDMMRVKTGLATSSCRIKIFFMVNEQFSLYSWITGNFELHCTFSPLVTPAVAVDTADKMLRHLRKEEKKLFLAASAPAVLYG
ncbi:SAND family protein [Aphelenchoides avenae]|nr:SAND family protein [Aphelenchus avenae]